LRLYAHFIQQYGVGRSFGPGRRRCRRFVVCCSFRRFMMMLSLARLASIPRRLGLLVMKISHGLRTRPLSVSTKEVIRPRSGHPTLPAYGNLTIISFRVAVEYLHPRHYRSCALLRTNSLHMTYNFFAPSGMGVRDPGAGSNCPCN
jgi:hypothetical protein